MLVATIMLEDLQDKLLIVLRKHSKFGSEEEMRRSAKVK